MSIDWNTVQMCKTCPPLRKATQDEIDIYVERIYSHSSELWFCGNCNNGQNEWLIKELLWDLENEFLVTPCCHGEAAAVLNSYMPSVYVKEGK